MHDAIPIFRLTKRGGNGLCCDEHGVALGSVVLVEGAETAGRRIYRRRPAEEIASALALAYGPLSADDLGHRLSGLEVAARALEMGDLAKASIATVLLKLPPLSPDAFAKLAAEPGLKKYNPYHKPAHSPDHTGGQFTDAEGAVQVADAEGPGGPAPPPPPGRKLRPGEIERARSIFGDRINYDASEFIMENSKVRTMIRS